jgi:hypothetical protein
LHELGVLFVPVRSLEFVVVVLVDVPGRPLEVVVVPLEVVVVVVVVPV